MDDKTNKKVEKVFKKIEKNIDRIEDLFISISPDGAEINLKVLNPVYAKAVVRSLTKIEAQLAKVSDMVEIVPQNMNRAVNVVVVIKDLMEQYLNAYDLITAVDWYSTLDEISASVGWVSGELNVQSPLDRAIETINNAVLEIEKPKKGKSK